MHGPLNVNKITKNNLYVTIRNLRIISPVPVAAGMGVLWLEFCPGMSVRQ